MTAPESSSNAASNTVPNPHGISPGCLGCIVIAALAVSAVPFGGVLMLLMGFWLTNWGRNQRHKALTHSTEAPITAMAAVDEAMPVTIAGKVTGPEGAVTTPLGTRAVLATAWMDNELGDKTEDPNPAWRLQLGERVQLEGERARIVVESDRIDLYSEKTKTTDQYGGDPPAHAPLSAEERAALAGKCSEYGERWLEVGMDVVVTGIASKVDTVNVLDDEVGYRGQGRVPQITMTAPEGGQVRISTFTRKRVAELAREGGAQRMGGFLSIAIGLISVAFWIYYFQR